MEYLIGMDGGGTKTHCIITNLEGEKLYDCYGAASNFLVKDTNDVCETLFILIQNCKNELGIGFSDIKAVVIGTTGAGRRTDAEYLEKSFIDYTDSKGIKFNILHVESDARVALEGAFSGRAGSILIAGTGSIMFGKDSEGNIHRVGGFGRFIGDEGSGFVIGKKGLTVVSKNFDGRSEHSLITKLLKDTFGIDNQETLINALYKNNFEIASVAPLVLEAANMGDNESMRIVEEETEELLLHIEAMVKKIKQPVLNLVLIGGIIATDNIFSHTFLEKIQNRLPHVKIREAEKSPAEGAVLLAKELFPVCAK